MCGIAGIYAFNDAGKTSFPLLRNAVSCLKQRGPDADGMFLEGPAALGHTRLAIIDLSEDAAQPMTDITDRYVIVFNGEIFNFKEQRKHLLDLGYRFRSDSDTEVLLQLYMHYGTAFFGRLNGFFALAIYDRQTQDLLIARDRFGVKPLYLFMDNDRLVFASEMKAMMAMGIPRTIDRASVFTYLQTGYIPAPYSIFENVCKLEPGHYCLVTNGRQPEIRRYYRLPVSDAGSYSDDSYETATRKVRGLVDDAVALRLVSDVPLGAFLSGGIDSSVIVAAARRHTQNLKTFSIGYRDEPFFDETHYANLVAKKHGTEHTVFSLTNDDLLGGLYKVLNYTDEPFADSSALAVNILSMQTRKHVTVALSGDGGDEVFAGYNKHSAEQRLRAGGMAVSLLRGFHPLLSVFPQSRGSALLNKVRQMKRFGEGAGMNAADRYWRWASVTGEDDAAGLMRSYPEQIYRDRKAGWLREFTPGGGFNQVLATDMQLVLPGDMLYKVDMMSMENGLEVRTPFLDFRLVNYIFSLPPAYKIDATRRKKILVDAYRDELPAELLNRQKKGFEVPMLQWLRGGLQPAVNELLDPEFLNSQNLFRFESIIQLTKRLKSKNPGEVHFQLWSLIVFQHWWKRYMS